MRMVRDEEGSLKICENFDIKIFLYTEKIFWCMKNLPGIAKIYSNYNFRRF